MGEFLCEVTREGTREELTVRTETRANPTDDLRRAYETLLRARLGVEVRVAFERPGALAPLTEVETRQKPIRLIDRRHG